MTGVSESRPRTWRDVGVVVAGLAWMLAFGWHFFSQQLPNNADFNRGRLLLETPWLLMETVSPLEPDPARPSGWRYFPERFDLLLVAAVILAGAWGAGHLLLRGLGLREEQRTAARTVFAFGLGLSAWSLVTLGLGLAGLLWRPLVCGLVGVALVGELVVRVRSGAPPDGRRLNGGDALSGGAAAREAWWRRRYFRGSLLGPAVIVAVAPFVVAMLLGSMLPPVDFDVKEYHLQGPKEWYLAGRISFLPHNVYTSFPFLTEMLALLGMVVRGDWYRGALAGQVVLMSFAPLTGYAVFAAGRMVSQRAGWLAVLVLLTTPWIYRISVIAYAEGGLTFYLGAALLAVMQLSSSTTEFPAQWGRRVLLCGFLAGSAMSCKYPGVVSVVIPLGAAVMWAARSAETRWKAVARAGVLFSVGVCVTFGPWALKNLVQTGNPVYPLLYSVLGGADWDDELNAKWKAGHSPPAESFRPGNVLPSLNAHVHDVAVRSDWQSVLVFGLAPLALVRVFGRRRRLANADGAPDPVRRVLTGWLLYAVWLFATWWTLTHRIDRFWVPMLPVLCLLAGAGLSEIFDRLDRLRERGAGGPARLGIAACTVPVAVAVVFNLAFVTSPIAGNNAYLLSQSVARQLATTYSIALVNREVPPDARVLMVGEAEVFDSRFDPVYDTVFDRSHFQQWTGEGPASLHAPDIPLRDADEIRETFRRHGVTHVFVNWLEILRYREPGSYGYTEYVTPRRFKMLVDRGVLEEVRLSPLERSLPLEKLSPGKQSELQKWGPELQFVLGGEPRVVAYQLFAVR